MIIKDTFGCVRTERVDMWPKYMIADSDYDDNAASFVFY